MANIGLKSAEPGDCVATGWLISGFRPHIAHLIVENGEYLEAACGITWWMSDSCTSRIATDLPYVPRCKRCQRTHAGRGRA
jgi:hypothetical protein